MHDVAMKIYSENKSTESGGSGIGNGPGARAYSALDLRASASGRSNLAALLRAEAVRRRFEMEAAMRLAEQRRRNEMRQRDRQLRSKPAWHLVRNKLVYNINTQRCTTMSPDGNFKSSFMVPLFSKFIALTLPYDFALNILITNKFFKYVI